MRTTNLLLITLIGLAARGVGPARPAERDSALGQRALPASAPARYRQPVFDKVDITRGVVFRAATNAKGVTEELRLDVYQPAGDTLRTRPAVLWIHGGGFRTGTDRTQKYIVAMATQFARRGYVSVAPDYRVRAEGLVDRMPPLKDAVEDCRAALEWVRSHAAEYGIDPSNMAVGGGSAGGTTAVSLVAIENADAVKTARPTIFALIDLWGSPAPGVMIGDVDRNYPPTLIVHGTADQTVPFHQSEALAARLKSAGIEHELMPIAGAAHTPTDRLDAIIETTAAFLYSALKKR